MIIMIGTEFVERNQSLMRQVKLYPMERKKGILRDVKFVFRRLGSGTYGEQTVYQDYRDALSEARKNPNNDNLLILDINKGAARLSYVASLHVVVGAL